ncbi:MAG: type IV pilus assembly protein PilM [Planctomycetota bacterium]
MNWKRNIDLKKNEILGLDIGSSTVKMVALRKNGAGYSAVAAGITEIAPSENNDDHHGKNTVAAIRECLERTMAKRKLVVCGISGPEVAVRDFELPSLSAAEMASAVSLEASQVCPFPAEDSTVDYQLMSDADKKTKGVLVAAMNTLITDKVQFAKEAHLKCVMMDVDGLALLNCFEGLADGREESEAGRNVAILNVGGSHTTVAILDNDGWPFIRDMTYAGDDIVRQVAADNGTSTEIIKGILCGDPAAIGPEVRESMERACQKLIADITGTLRYYAAQDKSNVEKLLVCGGFALAGGFIELLNGKLGIESVLWNPFERMHCSASRKRQEVFAKAGPALAVAAGLAMRSI